MSSHYTGHQESTCQTLASIGSVKPVSKKKRIDNWELCKAYERAMSEDILDVYLPAFLARIYGVSPHMIWRWKQGAEPRSWSTYLLSKDPDISKIPVAELAERYDLAHGTVCRIRDLAGVTREYKQRAHVKDLVLGHPEVGKMHPVDMAKELGCNESTVYRYMRENGIKVPQKETPLFNPKTELTFVESMMMKWR